MEMDSIQSSSKKKRKRGGRHGRRNIKGRRCGGRRNRNKRRARRSKFLFEGKLAIHKVFANPYIINLIGSFLSFRAYSALRSMYKMTFVEKFLVHRELLPSYHWHIDNTTDKCCVPIRRDVGGTLMSYSVFLDKINCPQAPTIMIMFGIRIFNPERNLWTDIAISNRGKIFRDDEKMADNFEIQGALKSNDELHFYVLSRNEGEVLCSVNNGVRQSLGSCRLLRCCLQGGKDVHHHLVFFALVYGFVDGNSGTVQYSCSFHIS